MSQLIPIEPGARERIEKKLKDIPMINSEHPCSKCAHYHRDQLIRCSLPVGQCDFYNSGFVPIGKNIRTRRNRKREETSCKQC